MERIDLTASMVYASIPTKERKPKWDPLVILRPGVEKPKQGPRRISPRDLTKMLGGRHAKRR